MNRTKIVLAILCACVVSQGQNAPLPDAPYMSATTVHNSPSFAPKYENQRTIDKPFLIVHGIYGASLATDLVLTSIGTKHGCAEANGALGPFPSTGRIVGYGLAEFAAVTAADYGLRKIGQHLETPRWMQQGMGSVVAAIGTYKHQQGAREWLQQGGCL